MTTTNSLPKRWLYLAVGVFAMLFAGSLICKRIGPSITLIIAGVLTSLSYGACPTMSSAFILSFYGQKHFASNFSLIGTSFIATFSSSLYSSTNSYTAPFVMLLILAICALGLNVSIRKP